MKKTKTNALRTGTNATPKGKTKTAGTKEVKSRKWWGSPFIITDTITHKPILTLTDVTRLLVLDTATEKMWVELIFSATSHGMQLWHFPKGDGYVELAINVSENTAGGWKTLTTWKPRIEHNIIHTIGCDTKDDEYRFTYDLPHAWVSKFDRLHLVGCKVTVKYYGCK